MSSLLVSFIPGITVERIESKDIQTKINVETCKHGFTKTYCNVKNCTFYASWRQYAISVFNPMETGVAQYNQLRNKLMKWRKKPVIIDAVQWKADKKSWDEIVAMGTPWKPGVMGSETFYIETLEGDHLASKNDWIIKGVKNEYYPCKPDIFEMTYEKV